MEPNEDTKEIHRRIKNLKKAVNNGIREHKHHKGKLYEYFRYSKVMQARGLW